jgi:7-cyano-7-deazaguanine synthase
MNVVILSGGLDSSVLLAGCYYQIFADQGPRLALSFNYGQRHAQRELAAAARIARRYATEHHVVDLRSAGDVLGDSSLLGGQPVPQGHYADESMKKTVVPNRNMIMLAIAAGAAMARGGGKVFYGAHAGDHTIYPDCRPEFTHALGAALALADWNTVALKTPFLKWPKSKIVFFGDLLKVPLSRTYSCYEGREKHCGKCGTCVERKEAFAIARVKDPTEYEDGSL